MKKGLWSYNPLDNPLPEEAGNVATVCCPKHGEQYAFVDRWTTKEGVQQELFCSICELEWDESINTAWPRGCPRGCGEFVSTWLLQDR